MKKILTLLLAAAALFVGGQAVLRANPPKPPVPVTSLDAQIQSFVPPGVTRFLKDPANLQIHYLSADFDKTGRYDYIVAAYVAPVAGGKLRVLKNEGGRLSLAGVLDPSDKLDIGDNVLMTLEYVDNSGVPVVEIENVADDGQIIGVHLFRWTGTQLVSMLPNGVSLSNAYLADPGGTGMREVINPPSCDRSGVCTGYYEEYRLSKDEYVLAATSTVDPSGLAPPAGKELPLPKKITIQPDEFGVVDILGRPESGNADAEVVVRVGEFSGSDSRKANLELSEVELSSVYLGRGLKPTRLRIVSSREGKAAAGFSGAFLEVTLPRAGVLQCLAEAQPSKLPEPGDVVTLQVSGRMSNGLAFYGFVPVKIVGSTAK